MTTDVVIIGAGAAGLTAAYDLIRSTNNGGSGYAVTILEAHATALGGRLRKMPATAGLTNDFPIDIGGEWIHKEGPGILDHIIDNPAVVGQWKTFKYLPDLMIYDEEEEAFESDPFFQNENDYHFIGYTWFDFFNDYIAPTSKSNVVLGCVVTTIDYSTPAPVSVTCANGRFFPADHVIVTVPLTVLQAGSINFIPPLPQAKLDALEDDVVEVPPGAKLFLKFNQDFYHDAFQVEPTNSGERFFYNAALNQDTDDFILGVLGLGDQAPVGTGASSAEAFKNSALQMLNEMYGGTVATDSFVSYYLQDWTAEPFIRGTYSHYVESGRCDDAIELLKEPLGDNRILFAGEHLPINYDWGYVHGAALSGRAAARTIMTSNGGGGGSGGDNPGGLLGLILSILAFCFA
jgi:monoamine oxidase